MTYRELLEITRKHPNPFFSKEEHKKESDMRYKNWVSRQNNPETKKDKDY